MGWDLWGAVEVERDLRLAYTPLRPAKIPISDLVTEHRFMDEVLNSGRVSDTPDEPIYVTPRHDMPGKYEINDGHHRVAPALLRGDTHINALVGDQPDDEPYEAPFYDFGKHRTAGANGPLPPLTMEPFDTAWSNGIMARHAHDGRPVGHLHWFTDGEIDTVRTHPDFVRRGVAGAMLKHAQQNPHVYESSSPIHHSDQLTGAGRAWANSDPTYTDPGDDHVHAADPDVNNWGWTAVKDYTPAHVPYTGQNEPEMEKYLTPEHQEPYTGKAPYLKKTPGGYKLGASQHLWPKWHQGNHPDVPFDKRWSPNHPEHQPGPWEGRTAAVNPVESFRGHPLAQRTSTPDGAAGWCEDVMNAYIKHAQSHGVDAKPYEFNYPSRSAFPSPHPHVASERQGDPEHWDGWHHAAVVGDHVVDWSMRQFDPQAAHPHVEPLATYGSKFAYHEPM